jgi:hypothetical protein
VGIEALLAEEPDGIVGAQPDPAVHMQRPSAREIRPLLTQCAEREIDRILRVTFREFIRFADIDKEGGAAWRMPVNQRAETFDGVHGGHTRDIDGILG